MADILPNQLTNQFLEEIAVDIFNITLEKFISAEKINDPKRKNHFGASRLFQSFDFEVEDEQIFIIANAYWRNIEEGRKPSAKLVPIEALLDWIIYYRIQPRGYKQTKIDLAYAIQRAIFDRGILPRPFVNSALDESLKQIATKSDAFVNEAITQTFSVLFPPDKTE